MLCKQPLNTKDNNMNKQAKQAGHLAGYIQKEADWGSLFTPVHAQRMGELSAEHDIRGEEAPVYQRYPTITNTIAGLVGGGLGAAAGVGLSSAITGYKRGHGNAAIFGGVGGALLSMAVARMLIRTGAEADAGDLLDTKVKPAALKNAATEFAARSPLGHGAVSLLLAPAKGSYDVGYANTLKARLKGKAANRHATKGTIAQAALSAIPSMIPKMVSDGIGGAQSYQAITDLAKV